MKLHFTIGLVALAVASCGPQRQPQEPTTNKSAPVLPAPSAPPAVTNTPAPPAAPAAKPPATAPASTQAAANLVHGFVELLNQRKFDQAYMLLGPGAPPRAEFDKAFSSYSDLNVTAGAPGNQEGAAGSIYLSIPLTVSGTANGKHRTRSATAIVRRVNDVPGSTAAQRKWHIERIAWGSGG